MYVTRWLSNHLIDDTTHKVTWVWNRPISPSTGQVMIQLSFSDTSNQTFDLLFTVVNFNTGMDK